MKIGLVQAPACLNWEENLTAVHRFAQEAARAGCRAVCFPECFLTGYAPEQVESLSIREDSPALAQVSEAAGRWGLDILAGYMERRDEGFFLSQGLFRPDGSREVYRKTHLGHKEIRFFRAGDCLPVFSLSEGLRIGFQPGMETHFPEITQTLCLKGAEVIFSPCAIPRVSGKRQTVWGKYIPARSYDNRVYVACCNPWDEGRYGGGCLVTDPRGEVAAACYDEGPQLLTCTVDRALIARYRTPGDSRATHFYPAKRRPALYALPVKSSE